MKRFAAVDEKEGIVWGVGLTKTGTKNDAEQWLAEYRPPEGAKSPPKASDLTYHEITEVEERIILSGDVRWPVRSRE